MKKIILLCFIFCTASQLYSQNNVSIYFSKSYANFKYTASQGNSDPNMSSQFKSGYGINYSKVFHSGFFIRPELGYKNLGAASILFNQKLDWSLHYLDFNSGVGFLKRFRSVIPFAGAAPYISYLYKASQTLGSDKYDLLADKGIKQIDYGLNLFGGFKYQFTKANSLVVEVRNSTGLMQLEPNSESGKKQKLYNRAVSFHLGISFNISNRNGEKMRSNF